MSLIYDIRRRLRAALVPALCTLAIGYFGYHAIEGDRGLVAWSRLNREIAAATQELAQVRARKLALERRTTLLDESSLDLDLLDERARAVLGLADPDDVIIFQPR